MNTPNQSNSLNDSLKKLNFLSTDGTETGLVFIKDRAKAQLSELFALEKADEFGATAVYFRRYENKPSVPQIYVYDFTNSNEGENKLVEIQKKIWTSSVVPLAYIFYKGQLTILDCTKPVKPDGESFSPSYLINQLNLISSVSKELEKKLEMYNAELFDSGLFWENQENKSKFLFKNSAYEKLLGYLKHVRRKFVEKSGIDDKIAQKLIVQSILVKYLEEREDTKGNRVFPQEYFENKFNDSKNFCDVLRSLGQCLVLFDDLNKNKFNGGIFEWSDNGERNELQTKDLSGLADFFDADKNPYGQLYFWKQYSFNYIPVELISRIYEEFLGDNKKGLVYTPPHLVSFIVDECLPLINATPESIPETYKVLDPACGSGIFLVSVFKRLVQLWRIKHGMKIPKVASLKKILKESIYGVDIEEKAVQLTTFSLSLAICDLLTPTEIWQELKFDDLKKENICSMDFFEWKKKNYNERFDLVIGNPPFIKGEANKARDFWEIASGKKIPIPWKQIALKFLCETIQLVKEGQGLQCLVMPSGPLFYQSSGLNFRKVFFTNYHVVQVLDFSALSRNHVLWDEAEIATAVVFTRNTKPNFKKNILHVTLKRTKPVKERILFEIDDYDFHYISRKIAAEEEFIWKANLLGGGRIFDIIKRFENYTTIEDFNNRNNLITGQGFITRITEKHPNSFLLKLKVLPTEAFTENGIDYNRLENQKAKTFSKPSDPKIYLPPNILIKENIGKSRLLVELNDKHIAFKDKIFSIKSINNDTALLKKLYEFILSSNDLYRFLIYVKSGQLLLNKNTAFLKEDFTKLPINESLKRIELSTIEKDIINDTLKYNEEFIRHGEGSKVLAQVEHGATFDLKSCPPVMLSKNKQIEDFSKAFLTTLNKIFGKKDGEFYANKILFHSNFIAIRFSYDNAEIKSTNYEYINEKLPKEVIERVFSMKLSTNLISQRVIRWYQPNSFILIKPNQLRYWLKSIAYRDADKVFADIVNLKKPKEHVS